MITIKETREAKLIYGKPRPGGKGGASFKANIPTVWARHLGLNEDDREVTLTLDDDKIIIKKK